MLGSVQLVTAPALEPITLADAKLHCRVDDTADDTALSGMISAARRWVERTCGLALVTQTLDYALDAFPAGGVIEIPRTPLQSVSSVTYYDRDLSTSTVFSSAKYQVDVARQPGRIALKDGESWPSDSLRHSSGVVVRFVAGFGDEASDVPEDLRHALRLVVAQMYAHREPEVTGTIVSRVRWAVDDLVASYRVPVGGY